MKGIFKIFICITGLFFIANCSKDTVAGGNKVKSSLKSLQDSLYTNYKTDVLKKNKELLYTLFDSVAYKSIDLVLKHRVYPTNTKRIPNLRNITLNDMSRKLAPDGENIDLVKKYIDKFIDLRDNSLKKNISIRDSFKKATSAILESDVYKKHILKDYANDSSYIALTEQIRNTIKTAQSQFEAVRIQSSWVKNEKIFIENAYKFFQEKKKESALGFSSTLKKNSVLLFTLLIISTLFNLLLGILFLRKRNKTKKIKVPENNIVLEEKQVEKPPVPISLSQKKVSNYISKKIKELEADLGSKYHKDCMETQIQELQSFISAVSEKSKSKQFKGILELEQFVSPIVKRQYLILAQKLDELVDKYNAQQQLERELHTENFVLKYSSSIISAEDVQSKIALLKKRYYEEMPKAIFKNDLKQHSDDLRELLKIAIEKMIKENSQLYFPYANAQGALSDDKKSKERERDSAIRLTLDPKDNTHATFQLLYEYSDMMQAGIQSYDILLLPICDLKSEDFNRSGTTISQNGSNGQMILENGIWKLQTKLAIKIT